MLPKINEKEEKEFPYWFAVFDLEPDYGDSRIWFECRDGKNIKTLEELSQIACVYEGIIEIFERSDDDPVPGSDDDGYPGIYFHTLHMRFKCPRKLHEAFHALSGFITSNPAQFQTGKYPAHFDERSDSIDCATAYALFLAKIETETNFDKVQQLYLN